MLQIASGKLFSGEPERSNELRGVLHTNLQMYGRGPIETAAGRLLPTSNLQGRQPLVYEMTELIEDPQVPGGVVSHGIDSYLNEFADIVSFALNVTCTPDPNLAFRLISGTPGPLVNVPRRQLVQRVFDDQVWCRDEDCARLVRIVDGLMGLERQFHQAAMKAIRTYVISLHRLADDLEVSYTLLVASIESLAQEFDGYQATWTDYEESKRKRIDQALQGADEEIAKRLRDAILEIENVSLARRFINFSIDHVTPAFFREEANGLSNPVGRAELQAALPQAYSLRSRYLHNLQGLPPLLSIPHSFHEVCPIDGRIFLTFQGMTRLARHVIIEFIERSPKVETEKYDYRRERFGILHVPLASKYWLGQTKGLEASSGRKRLEGFLGQIAAHLEQEDNPPVTDLRDLLTLVESMLPRMSAVHRRPFLAIYFLFNRMVIHDVTMQNFAKTEEKYWSELSAPSIEAVLVHFLVGIVPNWSIAEHLEVVDIHLRDFGKVNSLRLPSALEAGMFLDLAERYRADGDFDAAQALIARAVENYPRLANLQLLEKEFDPTEPIYWPELVSCSGPEKNDASEDV